MGSALGLARAASLAALLAAGLAGSGCASQRAQRATDTAAPSQARETAALAPAGLSFHARLDHEVTSDSADPGERLNAWLDEPLRATDGTILAPAGTELIGRVIEVDRQGVGRLTLQFDGARVNGRVHPIDAQIIRIEHARVVAADAADPSTLQAYVYPLLPMTLPVPAVGGGPPSDHIPVVLPAGAQLQLVLSRPFGLLLAGDAQTRDRP